MVQIIKCPCGKTFSACKEPYCYEDSEYQRETRKYIKRGCTVKMVSEGEWKFEDCTCVNMQPPQVTNQTDLFANKEQEAQVSDTTKTSEE